MHSITVMKRNLLLALPTLLLGSGPVLGTTSAQSPESYNRVIELRETPRRSLPQPVECPADAAVAAYHRPAQNGVVAGCSAPAIKPVTGREIPVSVHSAP